MHRRKTMKNTVKLNKDNPVDVLYHDAYQIGYHRDVMDVSDLRNRQDINYNKLFAQHEQGRDNYYAEQRQRLFMITA